MGGLDIFYIRKIKDGWTKPKNIGYQLIQKEMKLATLVSTSGKKLFIKKNKAFGTSINLTYMKLARPKKWL